MTPSSGILNLPEQSAILAFNRSGKTFQPVHIVAAPDLDPRQTRLMAHHSERFSHGHSGATRGAVDVILDQTLRDAARRRR